MQKIIHHMRTRPEHEQRRFSLAVAGTITALIALVWIVNTRASIKNALNTPTSPEVRGPFTLIKEQFSLVADRVSAVFENAAEKSSEMEQ